MWQFFKIQLAIVPVIDADEDFLKHYWSIFPDKEK